MSEDEHQTSDDLARDIGFSRPAVAITVLFLFAGLNACSYFLRTDYAWRRLTRDTESVQLVGPDLHLGFPLAMAFTPGRGFVVSDQWVALVSNVLCAFVVALTGAYYFGTSDSDAALSSVSQLCSKRRNPMRFRFRLTHLFVVTTFTAILLGLLAGGPEPSERALKLVYLGGPCLIVWTFFMTKKWAKSQAYVLLAVIGIMAAIAAKFSQELFRDFTFGMFAMFVCWLPQMLLMLVLTIAIQRVQAAAEGLDKAN